MSGLNSKQEPGLIYYMSLSKARTASIFRLAHCTGQRNTKQLGGTYTEITPPHVLNEASSTTALAKTE